MYIGLLMFGDSRVLYNSSSTLRKLRSNALPVATNDLSDSNSGPGDYKLFAPATKPLLKYVLHHTCITSQLLVYTYHNLSSSLYKYLNFFIFKIEKLFFIFRFCAIKEFTVVFGVGTRNLFSPTNYCTLP